MIKLVCYVMHYVRLILCAAFGVKTMILVRSFLTLNELHRSTTIRGYRDLSLLISKM